MADNAEDTDSESHLDNESMATTSDCNADMSHAAQHSKTPYGTGSADPTQLQFYPSNWGEMLSIAKGFWHLFLAMVFAFPKCHDHKDEHQECLMKAIAEFEKEDSILEPGEAYLLMC